VCVLLLFAACSASPTGNVVVLQEATGPRDITVNGSAQPATTPAAQPSAPATTQPAEEPVRRIPTNVLPPPPGEIIVIPESKPAADPVQDCMNKCETSCKTSSALACGKSTGADCKANCGPIIDPSACATACSLRNAHSCEPKFIEFCTSKCAGRCY
jgi:hypothetical protein